MAENKVVVHRRGGALEKGNTSDFRPGRESFHLQLPGGEVSTVAVADLKAVFFVKDFAGDPDYDEAYRDTVPGGGKKVEVTFEDGEVVVGFATSYSPARQGWFFVPADAGSNNLRVYAVNAAVESVRTLS